jgi:hypothetical protein
VTPERTGRWLAAFGLAVVVGHHLGALPGGLGDAGGSTRWVDWIDLLTPYAVVGSAALALVAGRAPWQVWLLSAAGAIAYVQGHGIHLAANSVGNARGDGPPVHLWDEVVGHWIWYAGLAALMVALTLVARRTALRAGLLGMALAFGVGVTWATNALEGGTVLGSLPFALVMTGWGWQMRGQAAGRLLLAAFPVAVVALVGWGLLQGGFPQPSDVGWS